MAEEARRWLSACDAVRDLGGDVEAMEVHARAAVAALRSVASFDSSVAVELVALGLTEEWFLTRLAKADIEAGRALAAERARFYAFEKRPDVHQAFESECARLTQRAVDLWEVTATDTWPDRMVPLSRAEKKKNQARCRAIALRDRAATVEESRESVRIVLNVEAAFVNDVIAGGGVFDATRVFSRIATTKFQMAEREEFQAGRNAWAAFGLQVQFLGRAECTPAIAGYSLLYPLSDNYLDDPAVPLQDKLPFQHRFGQWLRGLECAPQSKMEEQVLECVRLVEESHSHEEAPFVWEALLAIHTAQTESLQQHSEAADERRLTEISMYKGGTSVLADMYAIDRKPSRRAAMFAFFLGVGLQLVDDLQDVKEDAAAGQHTVFTHVLRSSAMRSGGLVRRLCRFMALLSGQTLTERGIFCMSVQMVMKAIARTAENMEPAFLDEAEAYCALPMSGMKKLAGLRTLLKMVKQNRV